MKEESHSGSRNPLQPFQLLPEHFQRNNTSVTTGRRKHHQKLDAITALIPTDTKTENTLYLHLTETYPFIKTQHDLLQSFRFESHFKKSMRHYFPIYFAGTQVLISYSKNVAKLN